MLLYMNKAGIYGGQNKIGVHVYHVGIANLQYIHDNLSKWHIDCWVLHTKWYPSVRISKHDLGRRLYGGQGQHKIGGAHLGHVGMHDMIIC